MPTKDKFYLGDGLYAHYDGRGIWLTAEDGTRVTDRVFLEPHVWMALKKYVEELANGD